MLANGQKSIFRAQWMPVTDGIFAVLWFVQQAIFA